MLKRLAILGGAVLIVAVILMAVYYQQRDAVSEGYDIKCVQDGQPSSTAGSLACKIRSGKDAEQSKPSPPWWNVLLAWPEGITAWLLLLTLGAIVWQAWETRKAAQAALSQIELAKNKERARIQLEPKRLEIVNPLLDIQFIGGGITVINIGLSRAFIGRSYWRFFVAPEPALSANGDGPPSLDIPRNFVDPNIEPIICEVVLEDDPLDLSEFVETLTQGKKIIHLYGFIEYETVGSLWRKDFGWIWSPVSGFPNPQTLNKRIANGMWNRDPMHDRTEYEIQPQNKPKQAN
jgi:hypothetical protein